MLQLLIKPNQRYSAPELAQIAIEGHCTWIVVDRFTAADRDLMSDIEAVCRESEVILTAADNLDAVRADHNLHGIIVLDTFAAPSATKLREELGPHAIIGYIVTTPAQVTALAAADCDFAVIDHDALPQLITHIRQVEQGFPVVALTGNPHPDPDQLLSLGYSGLMCTTALIGGSNDDPAQAIRTIVDSLPA